MSMFCSFTSQMLCVRDGKHESGWLGDVDLLGSCGIFFVRRSVWRVIGGSANIFQRWWVGHIG